MRISVIMPVLNEERVLAATLRELDARLEEIEESAGGAAVSEVIAVDGGSSDGTLEILSKFPRIRALQCVRGRASQMNAGAAAARGDWLLFLHADTILPAGGLGAILALPGGVDAGGFKQRFSGEGLSLRFVSWLDNIRCRLSRVLYGDQAMFVRRELFARVGGFPALPRLEDVYFGQQLKQLTRPVILNHAVVTDSRKFERHGVWRSFWRATVILLCVQHKLPIPYFANRFFEDVR